MTKAGERLIQAAKEVVAIARGEADPSTYRIHFPDIDVRAIRKRKGMTQAQFAMRYQLSVARLRDWEQGRSRPDSAVRAYLMVIAKEPDAVDRALAI